MGEQVTIYIKELDMDTGDSHIVYVYTDVAKAKKVIELARQRRERGSSKIWGLVRDL